MNWQFWNQRDPQLPVRPKPTPACPKPPACVLKVEPPQPWPDRPTLSPATACASSPAPTEVWKNMRTGEIRVVPRGTLESAGAPSRIAAGNYNGPTAESVKLRSFHECEIEAESPGGTGAPTSYHGVPIFRAGEKVRAEHPFIEDRLSTRVPTTGQIIDGVLPTKEEIVPPGYIDGEHLSVVRSQPTLGDADARVQLWVYMDGELKPGSAYVRDIKRVNL